MMSYKWMVLCLIVATTGVAAAGYGLLAAQNCYGSAAYTGQCSQVADYVVEVLGMAGFYAGFFMVNRGVRQRWKGLPSKRAVLELASLGAVVGGVLAYAAYYLIKVAGLVVMDYATCGGYSQPLGCFIYNPGVPVWFIFTGCTAGFEALLILAVNRGSDKGPSMT